MTKHKENGLPLPFDKIENGQAKRAKLDVIEAYEPKEDLMNFAILKKYDPLTHIVYMQSWQGTKRPDYPNKWELWKASVEDVYGDSWAELAPIIYGEFFE